VYGRWPPLETGAAPIDHLRWKLRSHPDAMRWHVVAEAGGELAGSRLFWFQRIRVGGRLLLARQGVDVGVHPRYRGRGVMTAMRNFAREEFAAAFDVELHLGSTRSHPAIVRLRSHEPEPPPIGNEVAMLRLGGRRLGQGEPWRRDLAWSIGRVCSFDERIDDFCREALGPFGFAIERNRDYLNWRYCDAAAGPYIVNVAEQEGRVLGYSAMRVAPQGRARIADLLALPERSDVAASLAAAAMADGREAGAERIECWLPSRHVYRPLLERLGFRQRSVRDAMAFGPLRTPLEELTPLLDPNGAIHLAMGDTDLA
jgi:GNAT superfamily N-acetyltransferase